MAEQKSKMSCQQTSAHAQGGDAWQAIKEINAGITGHHSSHAPMRIRNACGELARNDSDNADLMREHYHGIFNSTEAPVNIDDATDKLHHRSTCYHLSTVPTADKIIKVILSLPHNKMPLL
jgi:hypothetical protein